MSKIVFLLEERSMKVFLEGFLPRFFPEMLFQCIAHEGKNDLKNTSRSFQEFWQNIQSI